MTNGTEIRYEIKSLPFDSDYCHCRNSQRTTGVPFGDWMDFYIGAARSQLNMHHLNTYGVASVPGVVRP